MSSIGVLGLGNWGTALAHIWAQDGHNVNGWTIEQEVYESIVMDSVNSKYLPDTPLSGIDVTMDLADICATSEVLVLALPSSVILEVVDQIIPHLRPSHVLLDLAKGVVPEVEGVEVVQRHHTTEGAEPEASAEPTPPLLLPLLLINPQVIFPEVQQDTGKARWCRLALDPCRRPVKRKWTQIHMHSL